MLCHGQCFLALSLVARVFRLVRGPAAPGIHWQAEGGGQRPAAPGYTSWPCASCTFQGSCRPAAACAA
eukprot:2159602-Rhodomonas_salina.1